MNLGRLAEASSLLERRLAASVDPASDISTLGNLAELHAYRGLLSASAEVGERALALAREHRDRHSELNGLCWQATVATLRGDLAGAARGFTQAEALARELEPREPHLYSLRGIQQADFLRRAGDLAHARVVIEATLANAIRNRWSMEITLAHCVLGDLEAATGATETARRHYDEAVASARRSTHRPVLIRALVSRGALAARHPDAGAGAADLAEARALIDEGGFRLFEVDWRIASAWTALAAGRADAAREDAERARGLAAGAGYHWGEVDARAVLDVAARSG
jgi:ATP/maltotriose-dependent transcriptional regulator MalT